MERKLDVQCEVRQRVLIEIKENDKSDHQVCVICLDDVSEKGVAVPCGHDQFDFLCLASWLEERAQCPLCKSEVNMIHYNIKSDEEYESYNVTRADHHLCRTLPVSRRTPHSLQTHRNRARARAHENTRNPESVIHRRKEVYKRSLYSLHVGTNRISRFRDLSPAIFARDTELASRARNWIRRELNVFDFLDPSREGQEHRMPMKGNNAEFLLEYCIAILKTISIRDSNGQAEDMLQEFLGRDHSRIFLHELESWLRSPYTTLEAWDNHVQYKEDLDLPNRTIGGESSGVDTRPSRKRRQSSESAVPGPSVKINWHSNRNQMQQRRYDSYRPQY